MDRVEASMAFSPASGSITPILMILHTLWEVRAIKISACHVPRVLIVKIGHMIF